MATVKVRVVVDELSNVMTQFDCIKVYRSATQDGVYTEITDVDTRMDLVEDVVVYEFIDTEAASLYVWYRTSYYHSTNFLESSMSAPMQGSQSNLYCSLQDIRAEGVDSDELSDARALTLSRGWQLWFEHKTGQWFYSRQIDDWRIDGNGSRVLWLRVPIIELTALYLNDDFTNAVDEDDYIVYNRTFPEDDRRNPRIKLKRRARAIFSASGTGSGLKFEAGDLNQMLAGRFGYVESDGSTPYPVKRAVLLLVLMSHELLSDSEIDVFRAGRITEEVTDRHRVRMANLWDEIGAWNPTGVFEVDEALKMYRRPAFIDSPRSFIATADEL